MKYVMVLVLALGSLPLRAADDPLSAPKAAHLASLLESRMLDAFAAEDQSEPGRFVAVLSYPGVQMLVVAGNYAAPDVLRRRIQAGEYREVYTDLSTAAAREGRLFVEDFGAPGLRPMREDGRPFDITWRDTTSSIKYDAGWRAQKLTEAEYRDRFVRDDADYALLLDVLTAGLTASSTPAAGAGAGASRQGTKARDS